MSSERKDPTPVPLPEVGHLGSEVVHDGRVVHLSIDRVRFPDGSEGHLELIRHKGASAVVPFKGEAGDPDPMVVLVHQYRYAAGGWVYEIPAGIPVEGESWEACARRELEEETGYRAGDLIPFTRIFTTPGFTNEVIHLFLATGLSRGSIRRDRDEFMEVVELPLSQALGMVEAGDIRDGKSLVGLLFVERFLRDFPSALGVCNLLPRERHRKRRGRGQGSPGKRPKTRSTCPRERTRSLHDPRGEGGFRLVWILPYREIRGGVCSRAPS